jgi:zinc transporter
MPLYYVAVLSSTQFLPDHEGLICAFQLDPPAAREHDVLGDLDAAGPLWLHFTLSDVRAQHWIEEQAPIPDDARLALCEPDARVGAEIFADSFVAVLGDLHHDFRGDPEQVGELRIYVDARRMISVRRRPLRTTDRLRHEMRSGCEHTTPIALFTHLIELLAHTFAAVVVELTDEIDEAEDRVLAGRYLDQGTSLARMRRVMVRLRRFIASDRAALVHLASRLPAVFAAEDRQHLREAIDTLDAVAQDLELVQERARLLQEEIAGRVGEATNRNLYVLSIVTTLLLPITLITGVFGMNVAGLPWLEHPQGFWLVMVVMLVALVVSLYFLRRRRML